MIEAIPEVLPTAKHQRCTVHLYRNIFSVTTRTKIKCDAMMPKAIYSQESKKDAREKVEFLKNELMKMKLNGTEKKLTECIKETFIYELFNTHWRKIRTNNTGLNREIKIRTRFIVARTGGESELLLVYARLRHVAGTH